MHRLVLLAVAAAALIAACGEEERPPCPSPAFPSAGALPPAPSGFALAIGREDAGHMRVGTPWQEGDRVGLVTGGQGGWMIRPALDVTTPAPLPESGARYGCVAVRMTADIPGGAPVVIVGVAAQRLAETTSTYHVTPLFGLLGFDRSKYDGVSVPLRFDALTDAGGGSVALTVVPDATLAP